MLNIPSLPRSSFKRHFIDRVFAELRFQPIGVDWNAVMPKFSAAFLKLNFVVHQFADETKIEVKGMQPGSTKIQGLGLTANRIGVIARTADGKRSIEIHSDRVIITDQAYAGFEDFWQTVDKAISETAKLFGIEEFNWLGIRKINRVTSESADTNYTGEGVNELLFAPLRSGILDGRKLKLGEFAYVLEEAGVTCTLRGSAVRDSDPKFMTLILDFDCNQAISGSDFKKVSEVADKLNKLHFDMFCWATDPELLKAMSN